MREFFDEAPPTHPNNTTSFTANLHSQETSSPYQSPYLRKSIVHNTNHPQRSTQPPVILTETAMGLLKSGIKYGGIAYAINRISKGVASHQEGKTATPPAQQSQQPQQPPQYHGRGPYYDQSGYLHQNWCDSTCGHQCNGKKN